MLWRVALIAAVTLLCGCGATVLGENPEGIWFREPFAGGGDMAGQAQRHCAKYGKTSNANRSILHDRLGRYEAALADYEQALALDAGAVKGPDLFHRILYGNTHPATLRNRADYLRQQFAPPESKRVISCPSSTPGAPVASVDLQNSSLYRCADFCCNTDRRWRKFF